jgi:glycosyltransferase involved in cell wall biosynthesis
MSSSSDCGSGVKHGSLPPPDGCAMKILVATDAWRPQVNGVVRTYERLAAEVGQFGAELVFLTPEPFPTLPLPTYPEIRLAMLGRNDVAAVVAEAEPGLIHVATEGPIGLASRGYCRRAGRPFTTSYHTRFPDYLSARLPVPLEFGYALQRWFHNAGAGMLVATPSLAADLAARGFRNILPWTRGVDTELFRPRSERLFGASPVLLFVGRVSVEKNIEAFLQLAVSGQKVVVGGGPQLEELRARYPGVLFTGPKTGEELARHYASADVFVFPSRTDTFGIVLLEAMASGLPVAAYPVTGPLDVVADGIAGALDEDLQAAVVRALSLDRAGAREHALRFSWREAARLFLAGIAQANLAAGHRPAGIHTLAAAAAADRPTKEHV